MKKALLTLAMSAFAFLSSQAQTSLTGNITSSRTLTDKCYKLFGCVLVKSGATLTIPAGTIIFGDSATKGSLIIERGAKLIANGTSTNPIVFTSGKAAGTRRPGDWGGIIICGKAPNNQCGDTFQVEGPCFPIFAGGTDANDSSGSLQYVQIHYAGVAFTVDNEINSLTLASVGRKTVINHIQVTNANDDAIEWFGGNVNAKYLFALDTRDDDFDTDFGFTGKNQFGFSLRKDTSKHDISGSNGFESDNNNASGTNYASCNGGSRTHGIFSNFTVLGPNWCTAGTVNNEFKRGAHIRRNSALQIVNTVIAGWPLEGLYVENQPTILNTATDALNFSYNTLAGNGARGSVGNLGTSDATYWTANGCSSNITDWVNFGGTGFGCQESGNQNSVTPSYANFCATNFCTTRPSFLLSSNNMEAPDYTSDGNPVNGDAFFDAVSYRGAFGTSGDWTSDWTDWCPQNREYVCSGGGFAPAAQDLSLIPNPATNSTTAVFTAAQAGVAHISVLDKVSGQTLRTVNAQVTAGEQHIAVNLGGLQLGVYVVKVAIGGVVFTQQLVINN